MAFPTPNSNPNSKLTSNHNPNLSPNRKPCPIPTIIAGKGPDDVVYAYILFMPLGMTMASLVVSQRAIFARLVSRFYEACRNAMECHEPYPKTPRPHVIQLYV